MAAQGAFGTDFYDRSILRPKHRAYYRSGRPVIKIGPKGALGSHEIRPIHSAPILGQSIVTNDVLQTYLFVLRNQMILLTLPKVIIPNVLQVVAHTSISPQCSLGNSWRFWNAYKSCQKSFKKLKVTVYSSCSANSTIMEAQK